MQGLELQAIVPVSNGRFELGSTDMARLPPSLPQLLASCHGLARLGDSLVGDPLDQRLFDASGWMLSEAPQQEQQQQGGEPTALALVAPPLKGAPPTAIVRRFEFSSQLQRNLVVVRTGGGGGSSHSLTAHAASQPAAAPAAPAAEADLLGGMASGPLLELTPVSAAAAAGAAGLPAAATVAGQVASYSLLLKGSPEVIRSLVAASSVPPDFDRQLAEYTREGLRVLAFARGDVPPGSLAPSELMAASQGQLEQAVPLALVGLAVLANPLRADSAGAIEALQKAQVRGVQAHGCCACVACLTQGRLHGDVRRCWWCRQG